jgi:hypothetical protein
VFTARYELGMFIFKRLTQSGVIFLDREFNENKKFINTTYGEVSDFLNFYV